MSHACCTAGRSLVAKSLPPEVERAVRDFFGEYTDSIDPIRRDLVDAIRAGDIDPSSTGSVRTEVRRIAGHYTNDLEVVFQSGTERGAQVGREVAGRRFNLDIAFDVVPQSTLDEFATWSEEAVGQTLDTITDETTRFVRAAHEDGVGIDDLADQIHDDLFDGRLQDWQADRTARTATIPSSNAGNHSAIEDSSAVGEEWLTTTDGRERETHGDADGQIVAVGNTFLVGGHEARYPGDPRLPLEEMVQCRCALLPRFRDELTDGEFARLESGERLNV